MNLLSLFAGYGGFDVPAHELGMGTIGFSEIEKSACSLLKYRFPNIPNFGDVTKIKNS